MANGSYYPGEGIHLKIRFEHGAHVKQLRATFVCEKDNDTKVVLSGVPNEQEDGKWLAVLSGRTTDKLGSYSAIDLTAEYDGGHTIAFRTSLRDAIFLVKEPRVRPPVLVDDWEWASK
jgi:hypothetical protein